MSRSVEDCRGVSRSVEECRGLIALLDGMSRSLEERRRESSLLHRLSEVLDARLKMPSHSMRSSRRPEVHEYVHADPLPLDPISESVIEINWIEASKDYQDAIQTALTALASLVSDPVVNTLWSAEAHMNIIDMQRVITTYNKSLLTLSYPSTKVFSSDVHTKTEQYQANALQASKVKAEAEAKAKANPRGVVVDEGKEAVVEEEGPSSSH